MSGTIYHTATIMSMHFMQCYTYTSTEIVEFIRSNLNISLCLNWLHDLGTSWEWVASFYTLATLPTGIISRRLGLPQSWSGHCTEERIQEPGLSGCWIVTIRSVDKQWTELFWHTKWNNAEVELAGLWTKTDASRSHISLNANVSCIGVSILNFQNLPLGSCQCLCWIWNISKWA
jgi:hypothetical protein